VLLNLLDWQDFSCRLYALRLISSISTARPDRTQECVYLAPLGVSRLVATLDDKREAICAEGLLLLTTLAPLSAEFQKLVAFENAFDRIFAILHEDGSLLDASIVIHDCLSLMAILLRFNHSNQALFRECGGVKQIANTLQQLLREQQGLDYSHDPSNLSTARDKNLWGILSIIRLFLVGDSTIIHANQAAFWQHGVINIVLDIAFHESMGTIVRSEVRSMGGTRLELQLIMSRHLQLVQILSAAIMCYKSNLRSAR